VGMQSCEGNHCEARTFCQAFDFLAESTRERSHAARVAPSTRTQLAIAAAMVGAAALGLWLILRRPPKPVDVELTPPKLLEFTVTAADGGTKAPLEKGDTVNAGELLDFQIEVEHRCYVYVFLVAGPRAELDWGPAPGDPAWEPGVYAPDWKEGGLKFEFGGKVKIVAVSSWTPHRDAASWNTARLDALATHCPRCKKTEVELEVAGPAPNPSPRPQQ